MKNLDLVRVTNFVQKYPDLVDWTALCTDYHLPESFIARYKNWVDWYSVSFYQKLTPKFVLKHLDRITGKYLVTRVTKSSRIR